MKRAISMLGAVAAIAIGFLFAAPPAHALTTYNSCSSIAGSHADNVEINVTGSCNITNNISADGYIKITATGSITTQRIRAGYSVQVSTSGGSIDIQDTITSNTEGNGGNVYITATGNVKTKSITAEGDADSHGAVEIRANTNNASSTVFTLGASTSNGVDGSIVTSTPGGATGQYGVEGGVNITNGNASATGGITLTSMNNIQVVNSGSRSGIIALNAQNGTLTLPSGTLSADGPSGYGAGYIFLKGNTISTASGTVISASQTSAASGSHHYVMLAANTLSLTGDGLEIRANGNGVTGESSSALVALLPKNGFSLTSSNDFQIMYWSLDLTNWMTIAGQMTVTGSGPLKMSAIGDYSRVAVSGDPITFENAGNVTFESKGEEDHEILITRYTGTYPDLTFSNSGNVTIDASANTDGDGGSINVFTKTLTMDKPLITFKADGKGSDGDGGKIYVGTDWDTGGFDLNANSKAVFSANGSGTGDAIYAEPDTFDPKAIQFYPGNRTINLGTDTGQVSLSATGGTSGGNGGAVVINGAAVQLKTAGAVKVDALGGDGEGGSFQSYASISSVDSAINQHVITATGKGDGRGGKVQSWHGLSKFDVLKFIKVDGGSSLEGTAEAEFGWLKLNNVTCQQRTTTNGNFPEVYWNCVNPGASVSLDQAPEDVASSTLSSRSGTDSIKLFVFDTLSDYASFFAYYDFTNRSGETWEATESTPNIYSSVWEKRPTDSAVFSEDTLKETAVHEIGHAFDHLIGQSTQSQDTNLYQAYVFRDFLILDYAKVDPLSSAFPDSVKRNPCTATPNPAGGNFPEPAPFLNAIDLDAEYICHGATVSVAGTTLNSKYTSLTSNHAILQHAKTGQYWFTSVNPLWNELYAQALAYEAFALGNGTFAYSVPDNVFNNGVTAGDGYFHCVRNWAQRVRDGHNTPSAGSGGSGCSAPVPNWYSF